MSNFALTTVTFTVGFVQTAYLTIINLAFFGVRTTKTHEITFMI